MDLDQLRILLFHDLLQLLNLIVSDIGSGIQSDIGSDIGAAIGSSVSC